MASIVLQNAAAVPAGSETQYSWSIVTPAKIAGTQHTAFGRYLHKTGNGLNGGTPNGGPFSVTLFAASVSFNPTFGPTKYSPVAGAVNGVIGDWMMGSFRVPKIGRGLMGSGAPSDYPALVVFVVM